MKRFHEFVLNENNILNMNDINGIENIKKRLAFLGINNYLITPYGVDVLTDVNLKDKDLRILTIKFHKIHGNFDISKNELDSLVNCPVIVEKGFFCDHNILKSLKNGPKRVGQSYHCQDNLLETLDYLPYDLNPDKITYLPNNKLSTEEIDKYWERRLMIDTSIIPQIKKYVSRKLKDKYRHLFSADEEFNMI